MAEPSLRAMEGAYLSCSVCRKSLFQFLRSLWEQNALLFNTWELAEVKVSSEGSSPELIFSEVLQIILPDGLRGHRNKGLGSQAPSFLCPASLPSVPSLARSRESLDSFVGMGCSCKPVDPLLSLLARELEFGGTVCGKALEKETTASIFECDLSRVCVCPPPAQFKGFGI